MSTVGQDFFAEGSNTALALHTPTVGATWTLEATQFTVLSATDLVRHNRSTTDRARKDDDIGDDIMDVSAMVSVNGTAARLAGVCARMSTGDFQNQYEAYLQWKTTTTQDVFLFKNVGGTRTQLGTGTCTLAEGVAGELKLSVRAGTQDVYVNNVLIISGTEPDSTLSGRHYAGIIMNGNNGANATLDTFLSESVSAAADLAGTVTASATLTSVLTTAILLVGLLTGTATVAANLTAGSVVTTDAGARDPLISPNRAPGQSPGWPGLSRMRSMRPRLESFVPVIADLMGDVTGAATVSGTLTTEILLSGQLDGTATVAGALTAGPALDGTITATATVAGPLTTQILLGAGLQGTAAVVGGLSGPVVLAATVTANATLTAFFFVPPSDIPLLAPDRQTTWAPVWVFGGAAWPRLYATRDIDVLTEQAYFRIIGEPVITRRTADAFWGPVEVQDVSVTFANADGALSGDYRGAPFTLSRYDAASLTRFVEWTGLVSSTSRGRGTYTIHGTNVDLATLEDQIPKGVIDTAALPLAVDVGATPQWLFGNVVNLPLLYVRDKVMTSEFDYWVCRGTAAAITGVRRVVQGGVAPFDEMGFEEFEPYPGAAGVSRNLTMEAWTAGPALAPDDWTLAGAGGTVAKHQVAGQFDEGATSAALTRVGGVDCHLGQSLYAISGLPLSWWQGREIFVVARAYATVANCAVLRLDDGIGNTDTTDTVGSGAFVTLTVSRVIDVAATDVTMRLFVATANTTVYWDNIRVYLKPKAWHEVLRTDLYLGYTAVRPVLRQDDGSSLYQLVADVHGLQPERNLVRAVRTLLSDATSGLGRTVDAASFDQAEIDATFDTDGAVLLDAPVVYLPFSDVRGLGTTVARDVSGHERHGSYNRVGSADIIAGGGFLTGSGFGYLDLIGDGSWVELPYRSVYDTQSPAIDIWYRAAALGIKCAIVEKTVGDVTRTQYGMEQAADNTILFFVTPAGSAMVSVAVPITGADVGGPWIHLIGQAAGGSITLTINTTRSASGVYTGAIATGDGKIFIGKFGSGATGATVSQAGFDSFALYPAPLSGPRANAHYATRLLDPDDAPSFQDAMDAIVPTRAFLWYELSEASGTTMIDSGSGAQTDGAYVGSPTLDVTGPLSRFRNANSGAGAVRFSNAIARYGVKTGLALNATAQTVLAFYRPAALRTAAGIVEKTVGGATATQWTLTQGGALGQSIVWQCVNTGSAAYQASFDLSPEDVDRWMLLVGTFDGTALRLYKNAVLMATTTFNGTLNTGVGDLYVGKLGSSTAPGYGDIAHVAWFNVHALTAQEISDLWVSGTWYPGGLYVDLAMTEARQAQDWLRQIMPLRGLRLGFTAAGAITCTVDAVAPTTIRLEARDGAGDGERTLVDISDRRLASLDDAVKDVVIQYRRDLLTGKPLAEVRRPVSTRTDANGLRIGRDRTFVFDAIREHPTADRVADYLGKRLGLGEETVEVTLTQEARQLVEGDLVMVTDAAMGYEGDVLETKEVRKELTEITATLQGWDEDIYVYEPSAFPVGAGPG